MALVNPNIAMSFRQPDIQAPNALAQFAQIQQIQGGRQAQELAQYQLGAAQRSEARDVARINALAGAGTDETAVANALLRSGDIAGYSAFVKAAEDRRTQKLTQQKTEGEIAGQPLARQKTQGDIDAQQITAAKGRLDAFSTALAPLVGAVQAKKPITHQDVFAQANRLVSQGLLRKEDLASIPMNATELPNFVMNMASSTENSRKALETYLPKALVAGGDVINVNPLAEGGVGKPLARVSISDYQNAQNQIARDQLGVSQGQLGVAQQNARLAQQKFDFERANPGFELKEAEDGSIVGVNKRTLQAFPVSIGGAAPTAAPAMPGAGMPVTGTPLRGKGTALTESQGNATAYGMRMREANVILEPLEKAGKTNTGLIKGVVGGTAGLVPFIGEKLEDASGSIFNALPQVLGGLSPEQQQVMQARINFITAILRKESGAAISANEFATAERNYFPKPGDDAAAIAQKQQARRTAIRAMEIQAGPGAKQMGGAGVIPGASANNPLGLPGL